MKKQIKKLALTKTVVNNFKSSSLRAGDGTSLCSRLQCIVVPTEGTTCYSFTGSVLACATWACPQK